MKLFKKSKKENDDSAPTKESAAEKIAAKKSAKRKEAKKKKRKGKGGFLETIGVKTEVEPTEEEVKESTRHEQIIDVWNYLRVQIDNGVMEYFRDGSSDILRGAVKRPALDAIISHLDELKAQGIYWEQPDRKNNTQPRVKVIGEKKMTQGNQSSSFTIQEKIIDNSVYKNREGKVIKRSEGVPKGIQAVVEIRDEINYHIVSIVKIPDIVD